MWKLNALRIGAISGLSGLAGSVYAAEPTDVTAALGDMQTDALTVAGLVLVAIIAVAAFKFMRKGF